MTLIDEPCAYIHLPQASSAAPGSGASKIVEGQIVVQHVRVAESTSSTLFVLGGEAVWDAVEADFLHHVDTAVSILRLAPAEKCTLRTPQGLAALLVETMLMHRAGPEPLRFVALGSAVLLAYELAIQCLMRDVPLGFAGAMDGPVHDPVEPWRADKGLTEYVDSSSANFEIHYFGIEQRARLIAPDHSLHLYRPQDLADVHDMPLIEAVAWQFAQVLASALQKAPVTVARYEPLMTIQAGQAGAAPYFCIPGAGAGVFDFIPLAMALGAHHPVHGFVSRGMLGDNLPHGSVESAAACYVAEIVRRYPLGGVHLVGHSFGGWIAFEMALLLQARGYMVRSLLILDSEAPAISTRVGHEYTYTEGLKSLVELYEQAASQPLNMTAGCFDGLDSAEQLQLLHQHLVRVRLLPANSSVAQLRGTIRSFEAAIRTRYSPSACFDGPAFLVQVRDTKDAYEASLFRQHTMAREWGRMAPRLDALRGDGNHVTLLKMPHIGKVVHWLHNRNTTVAMPQPQHMGRPSTDISLPRNSHV